MNGQQLRLRGCHALRLRFPADSAAVDFFLLPVLQPRVVPCDIPGLGSSAFARHYLRNHCYFLFLRVLRCFSSPRSLHTTRCGDGIATAGFPHSDIRGSRSICLSPRLFAAYHVLLRLREPQASPVRPYLLSFFLFAFSNMTFSRFSFGLLRLAPVDLAFRPARLLLSSPDCLRGLRPVAVSFRFALPSCQ